MKRLIVFDLDGTLAESKASIDAEMATLLNSLLRIVKVSVISGGAWLQFEKQVLAHLTHDNRLRNLSLLPTCGTKFYRYESEWKLLYSEDFTDVEKEKIIGSLRQAMAASDCTIGKVWGDVIEDRGSQITFSALGQQAPLDEKKKWDPDFNKRKKMEVILNGLIPEFSVRLGGATSVDVTKHGIDSQVESAIQRLAAFAPLHNPINLEGIQVAREVLGSAIPQIAVFDTSFHRTLPEAAATYPGPYDWLQKGIGRYGFHGTSFRWACGRAARLLNRENDHALRLIVCHLGGGCSLAATIGGKSVDTTMGFTPMDGIAM